MFYSSLAVGAMVQSSILSSCCLYRRQILVAKHAADQITVEYSISNKNVKKNECLNSADTLEIKQLRGQKFKQGKLTIFRY